MESVRKECPAKINFSLDVLGKRSDGYHDLRMIMQSIDLCDEVTLTKTEAGISVACNRGDVPVGEENICWRAARFMMDQYAIEGGISIWINKRIPVAAGLAGGSTDAAGVIEGMNELYHLDLTFDEMQEIGLQLGADVPFCLLKGTALAEGVGEVLTTLPAVDAWLVIAKPDIEVSTASVFDEFRMDETKHHPDTKLLMELIGQRRINELAENMVNVLESVTMKRHEMIFQIKNIMLEFGALGSLMSGSGPTVFGVFESKTTAERCFHRLEDYLNEVYMVQTWNRA